MQFTDGTLNVLQTDSTAQVAADLATAFRFASVVGLQENATDKTHAAVTALVAAGKHAAYSPIGSPSENAIIWQTATWSALPGNGFEKTSKGLAHVSPTRSWVWQPLQHRDTGIRLLKLNTHAVSGYTSAKPNQTYRDAAAKLHWLEGVALISRFMADGKYDVISIGGDFNARMNDVTEWWYPGALLAPLVEPDIAPKSIDHLLVARGSRAKVGKHGTAPVNSDHDFRYQTITI